MRKSASDIKPILNNIPTFIGILLEAKSSSSVGEWTLDDYQKALKWAEYVEKVTTTHTSSEAYQMINHKIKSALEDSFLSPKFVLSVPFTATSFTQAKYLFLELLLGNHFTPQTVFKEAILDIFKHTLTSSKLLENMYQESQEAAMERVLIDIHSIIDEVESKIVQGEKSSSLLRLYQSSPATIRKKTTATLIISSKRVSNSSGGDFFSNWLLEMLGKSLHNTHALEVVCWMLIELPRDSSLSPKLVNTILNLSDQTIFSVHPWLLAEVAKLQFTFFNGLLAKVFTHLQHLMTGGFDCPLGNFFFFL
eukprot:Phypoly_transcript_11219.p1 GENE.Phypoly_transcript_11219~~Phypoly_transcript_11219.p1  ORF type:complete len:307 (+),score=33.74 Phypoly_transcript_11219:116-1036(+)